MRARVRRWRPTRGAPTRVRWTPGILVLLGACALLMTLTSCGKKTSDGAGLGLPDTSSSSAPRPRITRRCDLEEVISAPAKDAPEWVIQDLLSAAYADRDLGEEFKRFAGHFESARLDWIKDAYWPKARKRVDDLVHEEHEEGEPVRFTVCRRDRSSESTVKLFLKSYAKTGTNPPITVKRDAAGEWKVSAFGL